MLILYAETAGLSAGRLVMNTDTAADDLEMDESSNLACDIDELLTLRHRYLALRINFINRSSSESITDTRSGCEPSARHTCVAPGPQANKIGIAEKAPGISLGLSRSTANITGHTEPRETVTSESCETPETCDANSYTGDSEYELPESEYNGINLVTDLEPA